MKTDLPASKTEPPKVPRAPSVRAVEGGPPLAAFFQAPTPHPRRRLLPLVVTFLALALVAAIALMVLRPGAVLRGPRLQIAAKGQVAVLPFVNATGETAQAWVAHGLAPMVADMLADTPGIEVVSPSDLADAIASRGLDLGSEQGRERLRQLAAALGGDVLLEATVSRGRDGVRIAARLRSSRAEDDRSEAVFVAENVTEAAEALAEGVVRGRAPDALPPSLGRTFSGRPFLDRLYGTGRHMLTIEGPESAAPFFEIALELDPRFLAARTALAACALQRGRLDEAERLGVEILGQAQGRGDQRRQAETLAALAEVAAIEGRVAEAEELHLQAQAVFSASGDRRGQARVLASRARLALSERRTDRAEAFLLEVLELREAVSDRLGRATTLLELGSLRMTASDLDGAAVLFADARRIGQGIGDLELMMTASANLGEIAARRGDTEAADRLWSEVLAFDRRRGDQGRALVLASRRAEIARVRGDLDLAESLYEDAREMAVAGEDQRAEGRAALALAGILLEKGYRFQARPHLDRSLALDRLIDDPPGIQRVLARFAYEGGDFRLAVEGQRALMMMPGALLTDRDRALLEVYEQALETGQRQDVPRLLKRR